MLPTYSLPNVEDSRFQLLYSMLSGLGLALCLPPYHFLPGIALFGLLYQLLKKSDSTLWASYWLAYAFLAAAFYPVNYWMFPVVGAATPFAPIFYITAPFLGAFGLMFVFYLIPYIRPLNPYGFAAAFIIFYFVAPKWAEFGMVLGYSAWLLQPLHLIGETLWVAVFALFGAALSDCVFEDRKPVTLFVVMSIVMIAFLTEGAMRLQTKSQTHSQKVAVVQPDARVNIDSLWKLSRQWTKNRDLSIWFQWFDKMTKLTREKAKADDLVVWPELIGPSPFYTIKGGEIAYKEDYLTVGGRRWFVKRLPNDIKLITGNSITDPKPGRPPHLNVAILQDGRGNLYGYSTKHYPYLFGEGLPFEWIPGSEKFKQWLGTREIRPGRKEPIKDRHSKLKFGVLMGFEDMVVEYVEMQREKGADVIVSLFLDSWSETTPPHWMHYYRARTLTVESGMSMIRSGPTGVSAVLDRRGVELGRLDPYTEGVIRAPIPKSEMTIYWQWGYLLNYPALLALIIAAFVNNGRLREYFLEDPAKTA